MLRVFEKILQLFKTKLVLICIERAVKLVKKGKISESLDWIEYSLKFSDKEQRRNICNMLENIINIINKVEID